MGFSASEVKEASLWEFLSQWNGYVAANSPDDGGLSAKEKDDLADWLGI